MAECFKCGISDEKALLFDAISDKGIVKICRKCSEEERLPMIKKPRDIKEAEEREEKKNVYERVSSILGFEPENYKKKYADKEREDLLKKQEMTLREIIDRNYHDKVAEEPKKREDLIDNFHWVLMRARRSKKLTQQQLAQELAEPVAAIKLAEEGRIPEDAFNLVRKLENYLGVNISKRQKQQDLSSPSYSEEIDVVKQEIKDRFEEDVSFDELTTKTLTISDLQEMKGKKGSEQVQASSVSTQSAEREGEILGDTEDGEKKLEDKKDLTDEEMDEIIFGKRED